MRFRLSWSNVKLTDLIDARLARNFLTFLWIENTVTSSWRQRHQHTAHYQCILQHTTSSLRKQQLLIPCCRLSAFVSCVPGSRRKSAGRASACARPWKGCSRSTVCGDDRGRDLRGNECVKDIPGGDHVASPSMEGKLLIDGDIVLPVKALRGDAKRHVFERGHTNESQEC